jgi:multidrug efflux pump subunit AcrA (membrane-fusion protein)
MTNSESSRLDRIEALVESNARAIEALANERKEYERQAQLDRSRLYSSMADLSNAQADLANAQANFYQSQTAFYQRLEETDRRQEELSRRQGEIVEILKILTERNH